MIETPPDLFEQWHALPVSETSSDDRFVVRRARVEDFEAVYDCVDGAFGKKRPRVAYDWLYRQNPFGFARCWILEEKTTGRVLKTGAYYPWPIWRGDEAIRGSLSGDAATVPDWQRQGLSAIRRRVRRSHPWARKIASIAGPNEGSRVVTTKAGEASSILGRLPGGVAVLRAAPLLARAGLPNALARPAGALASVFLDGWQRIALRAGNLQSPRFEGVDRFDSSFDATTLRTMRFPFYWCPHNADFLNWRYLDHPLESYSAFAIVENDRPVAYSVLRMDGEEATLAEFAAEPGHARPLLAGTLARAREGGCAFVNFFATPSWRHWGIFRRSGFLPYRTNNFLDAVYWVEKEESEHLERWQVTPGDRDFH